MLAKPSIRAKIALVIMFLLVAMTGMGLISAVKLEAIYAGAADIQTNWLPSVRSLGDLRARWRPAPIATSFGLASSQVLSAAQPLSRESSRLKLEVDDFLNSVKAA